MFFVFFEIFVVVSLFIKQKKNYKIFVEIKK